MNVLIVYDSQFGNTERLVRVIAGRLGSARLMRAEEAGALARPRVRSADRRRPDATTEGKPIQTSPGILYKSRQ